MGVINVMCIDLSEIYGCHGGWGGGRGGGGGGGGLAAGGRNGPVAKDRE